MKIDLATLKIQLIAFSENKMRTGTKLKIFFFFFLSVLQLVNSSHVLTVVGSILSLGSFICFVFASRPIMYLV